VCVFWGSVLVRGMPRSETLCAHGDVAAWHMGVIDRQGRASPVLNSASASDVPLRRVNGKEICAQRSLRPGRVREPRAWLRLVFDVLCLHGKVKESKAVASTAELW
jgi:hypothetical protein